MNADPLDRFVNYAMDSVNSRSSITRPPQHLAAAATPTLPHTWRKGLLGGPVRCSVCKVRIDQADPAKGCEA